jgi:quercetin dioxygenase-like cupin family protein
MALEHAKPGEVVDLPSFHPEGTAALVKTDGFEAIRMVLPAGDSHPPHSVEGPITVQCLQGRVEFIVGDAHHMLSPGSWLFLEGGAKHSLQAHEDAVLLVTIIF